MIIVIDGLNKHLFGAVLEEMHKLRARVFQDRLGWNVRVRKGMETDEFDALNPTHVVNLNDAGEVVGCMRLLQTTGPHMLADVFSSILDDEPPLRSAQIWEATRFCVDTGKLTRGKSRNSISYVTSEVMIGAFEYAQQAGVLDAVAVIDPVMNRVLQRSGNAPNDYLGSPKPMGKVTAMAALMDCSDARISSIREYANIRHDVFLSDHGALDLFALSAPAAAEPDCAGSTAIDLEGYFREQLRDARDEAEAAAIRRLIDAVSDTLSPGQRRALSAAAPVFAPET